MADTNSIYYEANKASLELRREGWNLIYTLLLLKIHRR